MRIGAKLLIGIVAAGFLAGCTGSTAVSTQPSQAEIQEGINRRLAEVDKMSISPEAKERMKAQIRGTQADPNRK